MELRNAFSNCPNIVKVVCLYCNLSLSPAPPFCNKHNAIRQTAIPLFYVCFWGFFQAAIVFTLCGFDFLLMDSVSFQFTLSIKPS